MARISNYDCNRCLKENREIEDREFGDGDLGRGSGFLTGDRGYTNPHWESPYEHWVFVPSILLNNK